ncbi:FK506-binding protein 5-like [Mercenaria mercenaria]|uniref:FK506-binding protein 5-like n=1 Tax=Mercenaria mercenaria TaxID=6596 RepID=UPI00234E84FA|nr:FK506-binding protein 5-like [Mercenaria mercenaria]
MVGFLPKYVSISEPLEKISSSEDDDDEDDDDDAMLPTTDERIDNNISESVLAHDGADMQEHNPRQAHVQVHIAAQLSQQSCFDDKLIDKILEEYGERKRMRITEKAVPTIDIIKESDPAYETTDESDESEELGAYELDLERNRKSKKEELSQLKALPGIREQIALLPRRFVDTIQEVEQQRELKKLLDEPPPEELQQPLLPPLPQKLDDKLIDKILEEYGERKRMRITEKAVPTIDIIKESDPAYETTDESDESEELGAYELDLE